MSSKKTKKGLPTDHSDWYNEVVKRAGLADHSPVRGCMIIKPYGCALWEIMQKILDNMFQQTGHVNAYFPLFVPKHFFNKEAAHVDGFAKECAVVTHYRLKSDTKTGSITVDPDAKLEEELIVRPTSETIIWNTYKDWIKSYRDLPLLINQWANVVRWEMRTRPFLRTSEFLWQEGHTAHATKEEAIQEAERMNDLYATFIEEYMALPVIKGVKSNAEKFAGAVTTHCVEALMRDGKALQAGTSHFLGQNFSRAFDVKFLDRENQLKYVWSTSWGVSTRLIGALIMGHGDEKGIILPPKIAPIQVIIIPIYSGEESINTLNKQAEKIADICRKATIRCKIDTDTQARPGWKYAEYEMKGIPLRIAFGMRDIESQSFEIARRDQSGKETIAIGDIKNDILQKLSDIQLSLYQRALQYRQEHTTEVNSWDEFQQKLTTKKGFISAHWDGTDETEKAIREKTKATIRCIPEGNHSPGQCVLTKKNSPQRVLFAIAY